MLIVRKSVSFPDELANEILKRAKKYDRSFSAQVVADMRVVIERAKNRRIVVSNKPPKNDLITEDKQSRKL